ncbi:tRNA (N(6)-L-threonylcarbamoyladenosine(37)-C(2))-methylthiotransferase MtaB [Spirochaeta dissipatitropha]
MIEKNTEAKKVAFQTLGCKLNQYESDSLAAQFRRGGYTLVDSAEKADCYIINTCTVTNKADRKSRNIMNRALRQNARDDSITVITGCFVDSHRDQMESDDRLTYAVDNARKAHIFEMVHSHFKGELLHPNALPKDLFHYSIPDRSVHTRAMVKVQDGCDNFCTFCIIPFVRGRGSSRPLPDILEEVDSLIAAGFKEIVLTGVNMSRYIWQDHSFSDVVDAILHRTGDFRVRISSLEPDQLDDRFLGLLKHPKMCRHLHLCLQSGSERILLAMRRMYSYADYRFIADKIRTLIPGFNITTDIIVGFPGESEEDFLASCQAAESIGFGHIHIFPYSRRMGTRAERMTGHVDSKVKSERLKQLQTIADNQKIAFRRSLIGKTQEVLVEKIDESGYAQGYGESYCPVRFRLPEAFNADFSAAYNRYFSVLIKSLDLEISAGDSTDYILSAECC